MTHLVHAGVVSLARLVELMSTNPRRILGLPLPEIAPGADACLTIFAPDQEWTVDVSRFRTRSLNTPFGGWKLKGKPIAIANRGQIAWSEV
jgi:dihydroorotase